MMLWYQGVPLSDIDDAPVADLLTLLEALPTLIRLTSGIPPE